MDADGFKGSFMELLIEKDDDREHANEKNEEVGFVLFPTSRSISVSSSTSKVQMLCFGGEEDDDNAGVVSVDHNCKPRTRMKTVPSIGMGGGCAKFGSSMSTCSKRKKTKVDALPVSRTAQMGKEKLGSHVRALQQLVSPIGKSDTASVLQEAFGYIRFLHDQVKVLSSAYMEEEPESAMESDWREGYLRKRGLCLVPVSRTVIMAESNSADMWAQTSALNMERNAAISLASSKP
ncbi:transcription factor bHLH113-like [Phalaenopsis equestris]|uniref:transcription factor bHLH113-like n=1 Tax=Phalaenopsis equestris TaxID=78828 RepID=UPI0009E48FA7|nr:transcription factor bHLH113-like [Phalaenopsis equestris]